MLLAMLFMLVCVLIGGTVLSAAAANGFRLNRISDSQRHLSERSAARLIASELKTKDDSQLCMTIVDISRTIQPVKINQSGQTVNSGSATTEHTITVQLPEGVELTAMQRLMMEVAVWQYMKDAGLTSTNNVTLSNFVYCDNGVAVTVNSMADFWYKYNLSGTDDFTGTVDLSGTVQGANFADCEANFSGGTGENLYDYSFTFGQNSKVGVSFNASFVKREPMESTQVTAYEDSHTGYARITTQSSQTAIIWDDPRIEKGGD